MRLQSRVSPSFPAASACVAPRFLKDMKESSLTIRRALPADATSIAEVHVASWRTTYPGIVDQAYIDSLSTTERAAAWARRLSAAGTPTAPDVLVAIVAEDEIVGFISGGLIREPLPQFDAELHAIYLLDSVQGRGIGRQLVGVWATVALERGLHSAVVRVLADNPARHFYERLGAEALRETELTIGGKPYPERWYGWRKLHDLAL